MSSRRLADLAPEALPLFERFLARTVEAGIPVVLVETRRTEAEQAANLLKGVSWTLHSRHLTGHAIDICPYAAYALHGPDKLAWDLRESVWEELAELGEGCGLVAGYRWTVRDAGHFEVPRTVLDPA